MALLPYSLHPPMPHGSLPYPHGIPHAHGAPPMAQLLPSGALQNRAREDGAPSSISRPGAAQSSTAIETVPEEGVPEMQVGGGALRVSWAKLPNPPGDPSPAALPGRDDSSALASTGASSVHEDGGSSGYASIGSLMIPTCPVHEDGDSQGCCDCPDGDLQDGDYVNMQSLILNQGDQDGNPRVATGPLKAWSPSSSGL